MVSSELCCDLLVLYCSLPMRAIDTGAWSFHGIHVFYTQTNPFYTHTNVTLAHLVTLRYVTVIDYHGMSREVVALAMNFTDRYLQVHDHEQQDHDEHDPQDQQEALPSGRSYQLIVMAGLFLAIKLSVGHYFGETVDARTMCAMSRGMFTLEQLLSMETQLLVTLGWRVHPPSPRVFLNHYLSILTNYSGHDQHLLTMLSQVDKKQMHQVRNEADFMLEHAVLDYYFCEHYPSVIAIAALCNTTCYVWPAHVGNPMTLLENILGHAWDDAQVVDCRQRLCDLMVNYHSNQDPGQRRLEQSPEDAIQRIRSPVSVAGDPTTTTTTKAGASPAFSVKTTATAATTASTSTFYSS
jgi:hypothetical protein